LYKIYIKKVFGKFLFDFLIFYHIKVDFFLITRREVQMVQSHDPPIPESGRDKKYYKHIMKDVHENDSVGQTSQDRDNRMITPTLTIIFCTQTSALLITTTPAQTDRQKTRMEPGN
jgi:hypothetical protein